MTFLFTDNRKHVADDDKLMNRRTGPQWISMKHHTTDLCRTTKQTTNATPMMMTIAPTAKQT